jgi:hypothetical protein
MCRPGVYRQQQQPAIISLLKQPLHDRFRAFSNLTSHIILNPFSRVISQNTHGSLVVLCTLSEEYPGCPAADFEGKQERSRETNDIQGRRSESSDKTSLAKLY